MKFGYKKVLVTGAGSGIGKTIALLMAGLGADILVNDVSKENAEQTAEEIRALGQQALVSSANVADATEVEQMVALMKAEFGRVDILVNNAGITRDGLLRDMDEDQWDMVMDVNLKGVFFCCKQAAAAMSEQGYGRIVNISSASGQMGNIGQVNYAASKGGVISVTKTLAKELARFNITVNAVAPGYIKTPMTEAVPEKVEKYLVGQIPLGRVGEADDVAQAVAFLASDAAAYITGQVLAVNGGLYV